MLRGDKIAGFDGGCEDNFVDFKQRLVEGKEEAEGE
jgi:hypothetical protein